MFAGVKPPIWDTDNYIFSGVPKPFINDWGLSEKSQERIQIVFLFCTTAEGTVCVCMSVSRQTNAEEPKPMLEKSNRHRKSSFVSETTQSHKSQVQSLQQHINLFKMSLSKTSCSLSCFEHVLKVPGQSMVVSVCRMDWAREFLGNWEEISVPFRLIDIAWSLQSRPT